MEFTLDALGAWMADPGARGLSIARRLQPLGGEGDMVSPPTFAQAKGDEEGPRYVWSQRRLGDRTVDTCLLDSPASQANRIEDSLLALVRDGSLELPLHRMEVPEIGTLTDLELPHRAYDAAIGTAKLPDGSDWKASAVAKALRGASRKEAAALLEHAPLILVLGGWDSHSGTAANAWQGRHEKAVWSKIVAIDAFRVNRPGGRLDPMGLPSSSQKVDLGSGSKTLVEQGLGVVPPSMAKIPRLSITMDHAEQRSVVSFGVLRQLGFGSAERAAAAWNYLAALAVLGLAALHRHGGHLRSECDLVCAESDGWRLRRDDGEDQSVEGITVDRCLDILRQAREAVDSVGLTVRTEAIDLRIHDNLIAAMGRSAD